MEWKTYVKRKVSEQALLSLNSTCLQQSKTSKLAPYDKLKLQNYFKFLTADGAIIMFKARAEVLDLKTHKKYNYDDVQCRLCSRSEETTQHILNECSSIERGGNVNVTSLDKETVIEVVKRCKSFFELSSTPMCGSAV